MKLRLHPEAEVEARSAFDYYKLQYAGLGAEFSAALDTALDDVQNAPLVWRIFKHGCRRRLLKRFPYGVIYRVERDEIVVHAVMHLRRKPEYWRSRLEP